MNEIEQLLGRNVEVDIDWGKLPLYKAGKEPQTPAEIYESFPSLVFTAHNGTKLKLRTLNDEDIIELIAATQLYWQIATGMAGIAERVSERTLMMFQLRIRMRVAKLAQKYGAQLADLGDIRKDDLDSQFHAEFDRLFGGEKE